MRHGVDREAFFQYLRVLFPEEITGGGFLTLWRKSDRQSIHVSIQDAVAGNGLEEAIGWGRWHDVYNGVALRRSGLSPFEQGKQEDCVLLPGVVLDIDFYNPKAHKEQDLPTGIDDCGPFLDAFPEPTQIVHTGYGIHIYWLFETPINLRWKAMFRNTRKAYKQWQKQARQVALDKGIKIDNTQTFQRVWRPPGFFNWKDKAHPQKIEALFDDGPRYDFDDFLGVVSPREMRTTSIPQTQSVEKESFLTDVVEDIRRHIKNTTDQERKSLLVLLLQGGSIAEHGYRDNALQKTVSIVYFISAAARLLDHESLAHGIWGGTCKNWSDEPDAELSYEEEIDKVVVKIATTEANYADKQEQKKESLRPIESLLKRVTKESDFGEPEEGNLSVSDPEKYAIIQYGEYFWVAGNYPPRQGVRYSPRPFRRSELKLVTQSAWEEIDALQTEYFDDKDRLKKLSENQLLEQYGASAYQLVSSMSLQETYFDPEEKVLYEAMCPTRPIEPKYNENIDGWLRALGGDHYEKLCDWIAALPQLDEQCCALYLSGQSGAGKGLLAHGLSRLWRQGGPALYESMVTTSYNAQMFSCPLVFIDEGLPDKQKHSVRIRALIGTTEHEYREKYQPHRVVRGAIRFLVAANNEEVFNFGNEVHTHDDVEANISRFLHIPVQREAQQYLQKIGGRRGETRGWVDDDEIAKHCLYLAQHRKLRPGKRFLVEGSEATSMHRHMIGGGEINALIVEWCARFVANPKVIYRAYQHRECPLLCGVWDFDNEPHIFINTTALRDNWDKYHSDQKEILSTTAIGRRLGQLSNGIVRVGYPTGRRITCHDMDIERVCQWAEDYQLGDVEVLIENLKKPMRLVPDSEVPVDGASGANGKVQYQ